jgi:hypothetical protein
LNRRTGLYLIASAVAGALGLRRNIAIAQSIYLRGQGMPYDAFDAMPKDSLTVANCTISIAFAPGHIVLAKPTLFAWIEKAAQAVTTYYGRFPVNSVRLLIVPVDGAGVRTGTTWGYRGAAVRIQLGRAADTADLKNDWVMTHEFVHLALPDMAQSHTWLAEGLAVYIEPVARVQSGDLAASTIWRDMARDMPKGLPEGGDEGLENTPTWGRTYWGGALFCLLADIEIRKKTNNKLGLQDAMRGVLAAGGNREVSWPIEKVLATADRTVHLTVLSDLFSHMRATPVTPDLPKLWHDLGVEIADNSVRLRDDAPLSTIREAITRKPTAG